MSRACEMQLEDSERTHIPLPSLFSSTLLRIRQETDTEALLCLESCKYQVPEIGS